MDRLDHALASLWRIEDKAVAVLFIDLDNFKIVNDSLGHTVGDQLLIAVAQRMRSCIRAENTVARFGGDEFAVLLKDVEDAGDAVRVTERISEELQETFILGEERCLPPPVLVSLWASRPLTEQKTCCAPLAPLCTRPRWAARHATRYLIRTCMPRS